MNEAPKVWKAPPPVQSWASDRTHMTSRQPYMTEPITSKHVCFYKSGDAQFNGLPVVINSRTFKTFEALLDSLSKRVPLPFGVRTITTPRGRTAIRTLDQLRHGQSYICSDKRTVKPIDLERARHKPPPWYHAQPLTGRPPARQGRGQPQGRGQGQPHSRRPVHHGTRGAKRSRRATLLHTPRRLVVFRNGKPEVRRTLLLQKRTTHSFEVLLDHISEAMRFPVLKLHTPDGSRLDGLSALVLCSGIVVAAGREPFRKGDYDVQKPSAPTWLPTGQQHPMLRKKNCMISSTNSAFSPSSEHYSISQIQKPFEGSACDCTSYLPGSVERETGPLIEYVEKMNTPACLDCDGEENIQVPNDEDIEKSFRVNQDGTMTVEMKVRLTIKEEETVQWTTTLSRSSIASQMNCISESDLGRSLTDRIPADVHVVTSDVIQSCPDDQSDVSNKDSSIRQGLMEDAVEKDNMGVKETLHPLSSAFGWCERQQKQLSVDTARNHTEAESEENAFGSYDYRKEARNGEKSQGSIRPVPKPRSALTTDPNTFTSQRRSSFYKPVEILQDGSDHETMIHVYGQQVCQENIFANKQLCVQGMDICGSRMEYTETCDTVFPEKFNGTVAFCSENLVSEPQASTTYKTLNRQEHLHTPCNKNIPHEIISTESRMCSPMTDFINHSASRNISTGDTSKRRKAVRLIVKKNHIFQGSERKRKDNETDILKEIKKIRAVIFRQATTHYRAKAAKKLLKRRNFSTHSHVKIPAVFPNTTQLKSQSPNQLSGEGKLFTNEKMPAKGHLSSRKPNKDSTSSKKTLLHEEQDFYRESQELRESICLPPLHSSSSIFREYVELWLQKNEPNSHSEQAQVAPTETQCSPKLSVMTADAVGARKAAKDNLACCVSLDYTLSSENQLSKNKSSEQNLLLSDNTSEKNSIQTVLPENVCLKKVPFNSNDTSKNNSASSESLKLSELSKHQEIDKSLNKTSPGNGHVNLSPFLRDSSSENTPLSQTFLDLIPQNNTLLKASLFSCQPEGKKLFHRNKTSDKKSDTLHSGLSKKPEPKSTLLDKSQVSSDSAKSNGNKPTVSPQGYAGRREGDKHPSLKTLSDAEIIEKPQTVNMAVSGDMRHVLEELYRSIWTLCETTRQKRRCGLEKSNSLPDFSSHMATTFGSSSRLLMAFLSVMALKDGLSNLNPQRQAEGNRSCSEALFLLQSLKEIAAIEDAEQLTVSLNALQNLVSVQLLESWRGFQELNNRSQSHSTMTDSSKSCSHSGLGFEEQVIHGLMEELGVPDRVREELADFCTQEESNRGNQAEGSEEVHESLSEAKLNRFLAQLLDEETIRFPHSVFEEEVNAYVKSVIKKAIKTHLKESGSSVLSMAQFVACTEQEIKVLTEKDRNICYIERTEQDDHELASDICEEMPSHEYMLEEKTEGRTAKPVRREEREQVDANHKGEQRLDKEQYVLEKNTEYPNTLDYTDKNEDEEKERNARENDEDWIADKDCESPSSSDDKLSTSQEGKFSLGERSLGNRFVEDVMSTSFSEDQVYDEEHLQMNAVRSQKDTMKQPLYKLQKENPIREAQCQLHSGTYCVEHSVQCRMPTTLCGIHVESQMKEDKNQLEAEQQQVIYEEKIVYSEEERVVLNASECFTIDQEHFVEPLDYDPDRTAEGCEENTLHCTGKKKSSDSVVDLIINLESSSQRVSNTPVFLVHSKLQEVSETDILTNVSDISSETDRKQGIKSASSKVQTQGKKDNEKHVHRVSPKESLNMTRTAKQSCMDMTSELLSSSLAFSYDSPSSSMAQEPDRSTQVNRVKSIREMFLAKSNTRKQNAKRHSPSSNSDLSDCQPQTSDSGGNHSQTSPETYSGKDDTSRSIAKGFVRKTIERLYGRSHSDGTTDVKRSVSDSKGKHRVPGRTDVNNLISFHEASPQGVTDLSYFNATSSFDAFNDSTQCVSSYSKFEPGDAILTDKGHPLPCENQSIHEISPELQEIPKKETKITISVKPGQIVVKEDVPYSLFHPASPHRSLPSTELEELSGPSGPKFTYFNLPNASDSELELEEKKLGTSDKAEVKVTPLTRTSRSWETWTNFLPAFRPPVVKKADNKVHPTGGAAGPVVTQPVKGQSSHTEIMRCSTESDLLDMLFLFCGQHCPLL
ncbi:uncharacterized protein LOC143475709 [Brachyhypopomus gauderio]|uniref:uncharacterized protein LOC143475709 n=1 Tax=Brachyhypopomus gauderio TaxID=698409 RepID=UPI0040413967